MPKKIPITETGEGGTLKSRMFPFITCTWNPLGGECLHKCTYCWARKLAAEKKMLKYQGEPRIIEKELKRQFKQDDFVFVEDMSDLFGDWVASYLLSYVFVKIQAILLDNVKTQFLFLTKNPKRYYHLGNTLPRRIVILGCTIESNRDYLLSFAPRQSERISWMQRLTIDYAATANYQRFLSIEPILDFDLEDFSRQIIAIEPWAVAVGYDNYANKLPEPPLAKTMQLIEALEKAGITVYRKTLREAWNSGFS